MADKQQQQVRNKLLNMVNMRYLSQAICIANHRRISDIVTSAEAVNISEVAAKLDCHEINLYRLMSFLAANGIFCEKEGRNFIGNELSEVMRESTPNNCHRVVSAYGSDLQWESVANMDMALDKSSETTPFERTHGLPFYECIAQYPEHQRNFDLAIASQNGKWQLNVPDLYDFSKYPSVCDLAGGCGVLLKAIMLKHSNVIGILFESPAALKNVLPEFTEDENLKHRFKPVTGNFLKSVNVIADLFMVSMTLHCFEDSRLQNILKNIALALDKKPHSKLLIFEVDYEKLFVPNVPSPGRQLDMKMMVEMGGRERSRGDWKQLLNSVGVKVVQELQFPPHYMGLECELI